MPITLKKFVEETKGRLIDPELLAFDWNTRNGSGPGMANHKDLWNATKKLPTDFEPYGERIREGDPWQDCSCGCKFYHNLEGPAAGDWGICWNPESPRIGLLTFEHQGCPKFDHDDKRWNQLDKHANKAALFLKTCKQ